MNNTTVFYFVILLLLGSLCFTTCQTDRLINGKAVPDISLQDQLGNTVVLSEIIGQNKYVLIDFWASWCKPCRVQHPELIKVYNKYKNAKIDKADGFEIYSVSLDDKKEKWTGAIAKDKLPWKNQVSDLLGFKSPYVETFQFEQIPTSYLVNEQGVIVGVNPTVKWLDYDLGRRVKE